MRRTYRSKKEGCGLDPLDVIQNVNDKTTKFDAFYIQNIKDTKRELSCFGVLNQHSNSNRVHKKKFVKRLKEPDLTMASTSKSTLLTPDKSLRVNKAEDLFDQLLNSSPINNSPISTYVPRNRKAMGSKKYNTRKKVFIRKYNYSSSDSSGSGEENFIKENQFLNETDIISHNLLLDKCNTPIKLHDSIEDIKNNLFDVTNLKNQLNSVTPKRPQSKVSGLVKSPLCSTPFSEKYRGQSIYKYSPIKRTAAAVNSNTNVSNFFEIRHSLNEIPNELATDESINEEQKENLNDNSVLIIGTQGKYNNEISICEANNSSQTIKEQEQKENLNDNSVLIIGTQGKYNNEISICEENNTSQTIKEQEQEEYLNINSEVIIGTQGKYNKEISICEANNNSQTIKEQEQKENLNDNSVLTIGTTEKYKNEISNSISAMESFYNVSEDENSMEQESRVILQTSECIKLLGFSKIHNSREEFHIKCREYYAKQKENLSVISTKDDFVHENYSPLSNRPASLTSEKKSDDSDIIESISIYDTCSEDDSKENSMKMILKEPVVRIERLRQSEFEKYYTMQQCNVKRDKSDESNSTENFKSFESSIDSENCSHKENIEESITFVTTRRGKGFMANDSFLFNLDSSKNSNSSLEFEKTATNKEDLEKSCFNIKALVEDCHNSLTTSYIDRQINNLNDGNHSDIYNITLNKSRITENSPCLEKQYVENANEEVSQMSIDSGMDLSCINYMLTPQQKTSMDIVPEGVIDVMDVTATCPENILDMEVDTTYCIDINSQKIRNEVEAQSTIDKESVPVSISSQLSTEKLSKKSKSPQRSSKRSYVSKSLNSKDIDDTNNIVHKNIRKTRQSKSIQRSSSPRNKTLRQNHTPLRFSRMTRHSARLSQNYSDNALNISEINNPIMLLPGKKWERSLSIYRRMTTMVDGMDVSILDVEPLEHKGRKYRQSVITTMEMQDLNTSLHNESYKSRRNTIVSKPIRSTIRIRDSNVSSSSILCSSTVLDELNGFLTEDCDDTVVNLSKLSLGDPEVDGRVLEKFHDTSRSSTARDYVLRRCNQTDALPFDDFYPDTSLKNCRKIGEGVYGEVFLWRAEDGRARVLKVIPVAGELHVNGEKQKEYHQIISEIVIAMELSALSTPISDIGRHFDEGKTAETLDLHSVENATDIFNKVLAVRLVYGSYPSRLLDLWELYDECKGSENDNPSILPPDQHYIVLELANAGQDLESYQFNNAEQAHALFQQVSFGLAVAEEAYRFEHRDLHWGNVLISPTEQKYATFVLRGRPHRVRTCGVKGTIIDYSLSRVTLGRVLCCDLSEDESLFDAVGDYQFEVYRQMRESLGNDWTNYEPYTNILWLHYTADKMITALRYTRTNTKVHKHFIAQLKEIKNTILFHGSACEYVITDNEI